MKMTMLVIAVLVNGTPQVESTYSMPNIVACEEIAGHQAVLDSYPDRMVFCWDGTDAHAPGKKPLSFAGEVPSAR